MRANIEGMPQSSIGVLPAVEVPSCTPAWTIAGRSWRWPIRRLSSGRPDLLPTIGSLFATASSAKRDRDPSKDRHSTEAELIDDVFFFNAMGEDEANGIFSLKGATRSASLLLAHIKCGQAAPAGHYQCHRGGLDKVGWGKRLATVPR
jgi:hypothetical protein